MKLVLFDYGTGNLHSLRKALERQGATVRIGADLDDCDGLVLPGVGAFGAAARRLAPHAPAIREAAAGGLRVLGICLGMQLLLDASEEGEGEGLGLVPGRVRRLRADRVPHMGWNRVASDDPLLSDLADERFYFANSFVCDPADPADPVGWTTHEEDRFPSVVRRGSVVGTQFHPEKSGAAGLRLLGAWVGELGGAR
jgi:glutamine amidotransferase